MALQEVFKSFAKASRESILAQLHLSDQEKRLIEDVENLTNVCVLVWTSRKIWLVLLCVAWVSQVVNRSVLPRSTWRTLPLTQLATNV